MVCDCCAFLLLSYNLYHGERQIGHAERFNMDEAKGLKLLLTYDVIQERQQDYYQFVMGRYLPALQSMGFQMSEAWHTAYGDSPGRLIGFVCRDEETMHELLESDLWLSLNDELESFVSSFDYKFVPYKGGFQL